MFPASQLYFCRQIRCSQLLHFIFVVKYGVPSFSNSFLSLNTVFPASQLHIYRKIWCSQLLNPIFVVKYSVPSFLRPMLSKLKFSEKYDHPKSDNFLIKFFIKNSNLELWLPNPSFEGLGASRACQKCREIRCSQLLSFSFVVKYGVPSFSA